jgi:hypothetical protein
MQVLIYSHKSRQIAWNKLLFVVNGVIKHSMSESSKKNKLILKAIELNMSSVCLK